MFMDGVKNGRRRPDLSSRIMAGMQGIGGIGGYPGAASHAQPAGRPQHFAGIHMEEKEETPAPEETPAAPAPAAAPADRIPATQEDLKHRPGLKQKWVWLLMLIVGATAVVVAAMC
jgi:hypothetical protein